MCGGERETMVGGFSTAPHGGSGFVVRGIPMARITPSPPDGRFVGKYAPGVMPLPGRAKTAPPRTRCRRQRMKIAPGGTRGSGRKDAPPSRRDGMKTRIGTGGAGGAAVAEVPVWRAPRIGTRSAIGGESRRPHRTAGSSGNTSPGLCPCRGAQRPHRRGPAAGGSG